MIIPLLRRGEPYRLVKSPGLPQTFIRADEPLEGMPELIGPSLAATAISEDEKFLRNLLVSPHVKRLNIGPIPTCRIAWDQSHERNLLEHRYEQRAIQRQPTDKLAAF